MAGRLGRSGHRGRRVGPQLHHRQAAIGRQAGLELAGLLAIFQQGDLVLELLDAALLGQEGLVEDGHPTLDGVQTRAVRGLVATTAGQERPDNESREQAGHQRDCQGNPAESQRSGGANYFAMAGVVRAIGAVLSVTLPRST
ncbi:MAG: hypothetical protein R3F60_19365 [bacterium]